MKEKKTRKPTKKFKNPDCHKKFASKRGVSANNHTASAASRFDFLLLFYINVAGCIFFILLLLHIASTARLVLDHTYIKRWIPFMERPSARYC